MKRILNMAYIVMLTLFVVLVIIGGQSCSPFKEVEATLIKKELSFTGMGKGMTRLLFDTGKDTVLKRSFTSIDYFRVGDRYFIIQKNKR